jgi:hypothetical protein
MQTNQSPQPLSNEAKQAPHTHMELRFNATEIGCTEQDGTLVCGASNSKSDEPYHYITIQGWSDPDDEDDHGIHFEIDDQINGDYNLLASCSVSRTQITVELLNDVPWHAGLRRVIVGCGNAPAGELEALIGGLRRLFRDRPEDLYIAP